MVKNKTLALLIIVLSGLLIGCVVLVFDNFKNREQQIEQEETQEPGKDEFQIEVQELESSPPGLN